MPAGELAWRAAAAGQLAFDWTRVALGAYPTGREPWPEAVDDYPGFRASDMVVGSWLAAEEGSFEGMWREELLKEAEALLAHRLTLFGVERHLGEPIDWNREHESGRSCPLRFSPLIDYRDYEEVGDAKVAWEPNRHQHLVTLGRAYRATGQVRYARSVAEQLDSWLSQCPFGRGMNWRSPLELAIRMINWVWALDLVRESGVVTEQLRARVWRSVELHVREITRKYSRGSSANNHRVGEAAGVFVATSYWPHLAGARRWREGSRQILSEEIQAQTYPDGGTREQAFAYHLFVLQFFLLAGVVARRTRHDFPSGYWQRMEKMIEFLGALGQGGPLPMIGDADDGFVLDLGGGRDAKGWLAVGAALFGRSDFKAWAGGQAEALGWLLGVEGRAAFDAIPSPSDVTLSSVAFPSSGYYLLQSGHAGEADGISVVFDCGDLGFGALAAHGHADALSLTLRVGGRDVLVDPGTYDYFRFPGWRGYFRSTRAHNTLSVDGLDQSVMQGPFLWGQRATSRCLSWEPLPYGARVSAEHDGYGRLPDPVIHRRTVDLDGRSRTLLVLDEIEASGEHEIALHFHFSEECRLQTVEGHRLRASIGRGGITLEVDSRLAVTAVAGSERPMAGWVSRRYHQRSPAPTVTARARCRGKASFTTRILIGAPERAVDGAA